MWGDVGRQCAPAVGFPDFLALLLLNCSGRRKGEKTHSSQTFAQCFCVKHNQSGYSSSLQCAESWVSRSQMLFCPVEWDPWGPPTLTRCSHIQTLPSPKLGTLPCLEWAQGDPGSCHDVLHVKPTLGRKTSSLQLFSTTSCLLPVSREAAYQDCPVASLLRTLLGGILIRVNECF